MKHWGFLFLLLQCACFSFAQKPVLGEESVSSWPHIGDESISNNGRYISYTVSSDNGRRTLCVKSVENDFKLEVSGASDLTFTGDSRRLIYITHGDSLCIMELASQEISYVAGVQSFKIPQNGAGEILAYQMMTGNLVSYDLLSGQKFSYDRVSDYGFSPSGNVLLVIQKLPSLDLSSVRWIDVTTRQNKIIWEGESVSRHVFDRQESSLAFISVGGISAKKFKIWHYEAGDDSAKLVIDDQTSGMELGYTVTDNMLKFSPDGRRLFFDIQRLPDSASLDPRGVRVDIWNYQDEFLQCSQLVNPELERNQAFLEVVNLTQNRGRRLEQERDGLWSEWTPGAFNEGDNDDYWLTATKANVGEGYRIPAERPDIYLVDTKTGGRTCIKRQLLLGQTYFSPGGKYVYWYDLEKRGYYTYNIRTKMVRNISSKIPVPLYDELFNGIAVPRPYDCCVWMVKDEGLLIYDRYDIWQVDPDGEKAPINVTNGYGRKHKIILRLVYAKGRGYLDEPPIKKDEQLLLCALNERNKDNGFYQKQLNEPGDPVQLSMGPNLYYFSVSPSVDLSPFILKARDTKVYLLYKMSVIDYPNLQVTHDFYSFHAVSDLAPERKVNWMTDELVRWTAFDGRPGEGILYKPENFESTRKYPIIFYFYERLSDGLHKYLQPCWPDWRTGPMNIPWFVSRGYLVFCPDIYYRAKEPGKNIYNYVVSAATVLSRKPWVDGQRMGIQGHSFGGYEVNYLVTATRLFAAAASAEGATDLVSNSGEAPFGGCAGQTFTEIGQYRMGVSLWENPVGYIANSPIFNANKITTPLLIMDNKNDNVVPWSQGVELFTALRRLGKPCWMLQYDDGNHVISGRSGLDYTRRLTQFFDHYLKGLPTPKWMAEGIPARLKGIDSGLEFPSAAPAEN